jgi:predicted anti-sigma-YlaC factor YlaD
MALVGQLPTVEAMMARALALDESFGEGAIHEFYITYYGGKGESEGGGAKAARQHLERALALSQNKKVGALVSFAETVCVAAQDKAEFTRLLQRALTVDADQDPPHRLANLIAQRRAAWLLDRTGDLFAE